MSLIVGTNTYVSVADADAYWSARNNSTWDEADDADKEKALLEATQYIDGAYSFVGYQIITNVLAWPRNEAVVCQGNLAGVYYPNTTVPPQIINACCELALDALSQRLVETLDRGGLIRREKVDVVEVEYMDFAPSGRTFKFASLILKPLTKSGGVMKTLVRS